MKEHLTTIGRIGIVKNSGSEWTEFYKTVQLEEVPKFAAIRADAYGVCGIYINGVFLEAITGRYANRIGYFACTSLLKQGENEIRLVLGNHYYQSTFQQIYERSGTMFSCVAAELQVQTEKTSLRISTDESWKCISDGCPQAATCFSEVTTAEYARFWLSAALWEEPKKKIVPPAVLHVAGEAYCQYAQHPKEKEIVVSCIAESDGMVSKEQGLFGDAATQPYVIYDLGRLYVGYTEIFYHAQGDARVKLSYDYTESIEDFRNGNGIVERLAIQETLKPDENHMLVLRRRAGRFLKLHFSGNGSIQINGVKMRLSMKPGNAAGWFHSEDELLNKAWEVGQYTLQVNKHQEYESCPRNEMKYFAGDAIIEALVDYYAFGDGSLVDASLSLTEIDTNSGIRHDRYSRHASLWDYPAWRILTAYNHYHYTGDLNFVKKYFGELAVNLEWLIDKANSKGLIYQYPCFSAPMYHVSSALEYNSSTDRLGEKPLLNALFYRCLVCMGEFATLVADERANTWARMAVRVKEAVNRYLWDEEKGAFLDLNNPEYIPQDGNALIALFGMTDAERTLRAFETIKKENWTPYGAAMISSDKQFIRNQIKTISPVMNMYEAEARFLHGDDENAMNLLRTCWGGMLKKGAETFWEFIPNSETERWPIPSHGWAAGCTYLLSAYVLGVRPLKAGYHEVLFQPCGDLDSYCGVVPTPMGLIAVKKEKGLFTLAVPKSVKIHSKLKQYERLEIIIYE